jgi:hypothetical protein
MRSTLACILRAPVPVFGKPEVPPSGLPQHPIAQPTQASATQGYLAMCIALTWRRRQQGRRRRRRRPRRRACPPSGARSAAAAHACGGWCATARARSASGSPQRLRSTSCGTASGVRILRNQTSTIPVSPGKRGGAGRSPSRRENPNQRGSRPPRAQRQCIKRAGERRIWLAPSMAEASVMSRSDAASTMLRTTYRLTALS